jgi:tellurite resistance protein TerC
MTVPLWAWGATLGVLAVLIAADLMLTRSAAGLRAAAMLSAGWIAAAVAFGGTLWWWRGPAVAGQYFAGYLLEKALSVDNLVVFVLLFAALEVPAQLQRRVLHFGVLGARMFRPPKAAGRRTNLTVRALRRVLPVTQDYAGGRFFSRIAGQPMVTPLFLALVAVEAADLVFALDSIPAVFGVTRDLFVVFTSNAFAVLGLRALYVLLAGAVDRFRYLRQGIALLLVFIGAKMLLSPVVELPVTVSLGAIVVVAAGAIAASLWRDRGRPRHGGPEGNPRHEGPRESPRKAAVRG